MKIDYDGRAWELDLDDIGLKQAMVIQSHMGMSVTAVLALLDHPDSLDWVRVVACVHWVMLAQDGQERPLDADFPVIRFADAFVTAIQAAAPPDDEPAGSDADPTSLAPGTSSPAQSPTTTRTRKPRTTPATPETG